MRRDGTSFMSGYHPAGSLAPRDVVARACDAEMKEHGDEFVLLDLSSIPAAVIERRFPNLSRECADRVIRITTDPFRVVQAAHYQCGGLLTDWDGRTSLSGLYAAGEIACTGVHGANRLASNSLLEAVVYAHRASVRLAGDLRGLPEIPGAEWSPPDLDALGEAADTVEARVRGLMWENVGIVRSDDRLEMARAEIDRLSGIGLGRDGTGPGAMHARQVEFMRDVATLVIRCAQRRRESRGLHFTDSHPRRDNERFLRDTVLSR